MLIGDAGWHAAVVGGLLDRQAEGIAGDFSFLRGVIALGYEDVEVVGPAISLLFKGEPGKCDAQLDSRGITIAGRDGFGSESDSRCVLGAPDGSLEALFGVGCLFAVEVSVAIAQHYILAA